MKFNNIHKILLLTITTFLFVGCNYLDETPYDWAQPEDVFSMEANYVRPVNQAYSYIRGGFNSISGSFLDAATDDGMSTINSSAIHRLSRGYVRSNSPVQSPWNNSYQGIRQAIFAQKHLTEIELVLNKTTPEEVIGIKNTYIGEMYALRALFEFDLLKHYGGYPIIDKYYTLGDPELNVIERSSYSDCVNHIVSLSDSAIKYLDVAPIGGSGGYGRMTKGAAMAIKAKTLIFSASPLFNQSGNSNELIGHLNSTDEEASNRWTLAAAACADVINLKNPNGSNVYALNSSYEKLFTTSPNNEYIVFVGAPKSNGLENRQYPPSLSNNLGGGTVPTQEFVDAFSMANGAEYTRGDLSVQYNNRDPRFNVIIGYNGSTYGKLGKIYTKLGDGATSDGLNAVVDRSTNTGYYLKKFLDFNINFSLAKPANTFHLFPIIRLSDILLLYAEAMNEVYGPDADPNNFGLTAKDAVLAVRTRAGFKSDDQFLNGVTTKELMREKIKNERRIELSFEEQRYFDLRRWMDGDKLNRPVTGIRIVQNGNTLDYSNFTVDDLRKFSPHMYLHPIPLNEIKVSPQIVQNPGW